MLPPEIRAFVAPGSYREDKHPATARAIRATGRRYGIEVIWVSTPFGFGPELMRTAAWKRMVERPTMKWGPCGDTGFDFRRNLVVSVDDGPECVFHELVHCILGPAFLKLDEGFALMQFEWQLAKWTAKRCGPDRRKFVESVNEYQMITGIGTHMDAVEFGYVPGGRRRPFWRRGLERCVRLGLLEPGTYRPTFQRPRWQGSRVARHAENWSIRRDVHFQ